MGDHDQPGSDHVIPEASFAAGYDVPLGDHLALRFSAGVGTVFVYTSRWNVDGGLVVRF